MKWSDIAPDGTAAWCNAWRARYRTMPFSQHQSDTNLIMMAHDIPGGGQVDEHNLMDCLSSINCEGLRVVEFGGWRGSKANQALSRFPLAGWSNYEICPSAQVDRHCQDPRYQCLVPDSFLWEAHPIPYAADIFVSSHAIEHLSAEHLEKLFHWLPDSIRWMYLCAPIQDSTTSETWEDYGGTHILEIGWEQVLNLLPEFRLLRGEGEYRWIERKP